MHWLDSSHFSTKRAGKCSLIPQAKKVWLIKTRTQKTSRVTAVVFQSSQPCLKAVHRNHSPFLKSSFRRKRERGKKRPFFKKYYSIFFPFDEVAWACLSIRPSSDIHHIFSPLPIQRSCEFLLNEAGELLLSYPVLTSNWPRELTRLASLLCDMTQAEPVKAACRSSAAFAAPAGHWPWRFLLHI